VMRRDNRGFMLAEVIIVSSIIVTVLVTMYTGLNKLFVKYDELSRYYNVDAIYLAKNVEDYLIDSYTMGSVIAASSSTGYEDIKIMEGISEIVGAECGSTAGTTCVSKLYFIGNYGNNGDGYDKVKELNTGDKYFADYVDYVKNDIKNKYGYERDADGNIIKDSSGNDKESSAYKTKKTILLEMKQGDKEYYGYVVVE
jgi:hypothetical protein